MYECMYLSLSLPPPSLSLSPAVSLFSLSLSRQLRAAHFKGQSRPRGWLRTWTGVTKSEFRVEG